MLVEEIEQIRAFINPEKWLLEANKNAIQLGKQTMNFSSTFLPQLPVGTKFYQEVYNPQTSFSVFQFFLVPIPVKILIKYIEQSAGAI